ncbi:MULTISPECIES: N-acetylmuramoyl-L-alanine amidase [Streptomyces]|uniref:N-acetylmuramoyl-L-alanine amidase n=1 Tax=Streptomyces solicathayae TaxID=3081768 RepID=A0ABZ0LP95_9ACTN|nr:N-acetylmuramoyl-L-alanine amidase [Streptomyces sp. HUAS YS2]WOX21326.1 N-acetylmuramoyl-L-alanine amidase [Streptomyces sp. HUAS YS2]
MTHARTLTVATAVLGAAGALLCLTAATTATATVTPAGGPDGRPGSVHSVPVPVPHGADPGARALSARTTGPFSMIGLTWDDPKAQLGGTAQIRTRDARTGLWSTWRTLDTDARTPESGGETAAGAVRPGAQPLWTGASDGVQFRATGDGLPAGLRVELVDPGDPVTPAAPTAPDAPAETGLPPITWRSWWGADESLVRSSPTYTKETKAIFVHHTAGTNAYQCSESASLVRGIFLYHVQSQGWNDIGYNFLVDKCGTVFEGRAGGIDKPVKGAHTYGFNTDTSSISVIGNYNTATADAVVRSAVARVAAWKLRLYGHDPAGAVTLTSGADNGYYTTGQKVLLARISGHRDGYPTECPGSELYAALPEIRQTAAAAG